MVLPPALHDYARIEAYVLPCLSKTDERGRVKAPNTGLMLRTTGSRHFSRGGASSNPAIWAEWLRLEPDTALAVWAGPSRLVIVDIDVKIGRAEAWQLWREWCALRGLKEFPPSVVTPSGGWHIYFRVPNGVEASTLRQPDLVPGIINVRAGNGYVLIPPSIIETGAYRFV